MSFGDAVRSGFDNYVNFDGRASRSAFWYWVLFGILAGIVGAIISSIIGTQVISYLISLALFLPGLAVAVRRLHDTGRSGWWYLIVFVPLIGIIVLIVFWCQDSDPGENEHGPLPADKGGAAAAPPPPAPAA